MQNLCGLATKKLSDRYSVENLFTEPNRPLVFNLLYLFVFCVSEVSW